MTLLPAEDKDNPTSSTMQISSQMQNSDLWHTLFFFAYLLFTIILKMNDELKNL
jgi:hypothetical protein